MSTEYIYIYTYIHTFAIFSKQTSNLLSSAVFYAHTEKQKMVLLVLIQNLTTVLTDRIK